MPLGYHLATVKRTLFCPLVLCVIRLAAPPGPGPERRLSQRVVRRLPPRRHANSSRRITVEPAAHRARPEGAADHPHPGGERPGGGALHQLEQEGRVRDVPGGGMVKVGRHGGHAQHPAQRPSGNEVTFQVRWTAPAAPGRRGVRRHRPCRPTATAAAGGDAEGVGRFNLSYGCDGAWTPSSTRTATAWASPTCAAASASATLPPMYSLKAGDCNDYDKNANPMGTRDLQPVRRRLRRHDQRGAGRA